ncbi:MAG: flagellar hook-length control protein FliK [Deltaproteobacteria bacterium]|nr:flagellar hook-length control protein FliK [Deltaproteobacteria bacterium]
MEIRLFTAIPAEAAQTVADVDIGAQTPEGPFEDLLASLSAVKESEVTGNVGETKAIAVDVSGALSISAASEKEIIEGEAVLTDIPVEASLQGMDLDAKAMKSEEAASGPVETDTDEALIIATPVQVPIQQIHEVVADEGGVSVEIEGHAGTTLDSYETEAPEAPVGGVTNVAHETEEASPSTGITSDSDHLGSYETEVPEAPVGGVTNGAHATEEATPSTGVTSDSETQADIEEEAKATGKDKIKEEIPSTAHETEATSGFAVNPNTPPDNTLDVSPDAVTGRPARPARPITAKDGVDIASTFQSAPASEKMVGEEKADSVEAVEPAEPSEASVTLSHEGRPDDMEAASDQPFDMRGEWEGGENGESEGRALEAKAAGDSALEENVNSEAFKAAPEASSNDLRQTMNGVLDAAGIGTNAAFGLDRAPQASGHTTSAASTETVDTDGLFEKLDTGVKMSVQGNGRVRIELSPEHLGDMEIRLKIEDAKVAAEIRVESAEVKALLDADSGRLKEIFNSNGLTLDKYTVEVDMNPMRGKAESGGSFGNCFQENASDWNGYGRKPWAGESDVESAFGNRYESTGKKGGIDIFA